MRRPYRNIGFFFLFLLFLVVAGFTPRVPGTPFFGYFGELARSGRVPAVVHSHAWVAVAWFLLLSAQPFLIRANRVDLHRWLGRASIVVVALFLVTAVHVMKHFFAKAVEQYSRDTALSLLSQSFTGLTLFLLFYLIALWKRRSLHTHVAFMVAGALAAATPGLARLGLYVVGGLPGILLVVVLVYATLVAFMLYAKLRLQQPILKSPYLMIIAMFVLAHAMDFVGSRTATWRWVAGQIVSVW